MRNLSAQQPSQKCKTALASGKPSKFVPVIHITEKLPNHYDKGSASELSARQLPNQSTTMQPLHHQTPCYSSGFPLLLLSLLELPHPGVPLRFCSQHLRRPSASRHPQPFWKLPSHQPFSWQHPPLPFSWLLLLLLLFWLRHLLRQPFSWQLPLPQPFSWKPPPRLFS